MMQGLLALRAQAINKKIDMTDALSEFAGTGREANVGLMSKQRFRSAMGILFSGMSAELLDEICQQYAAGSKDLSEPGTFSQVQFKKFALDFDEIQPPAKHVPQPASDPVLYATLQELRSFAERTRLDLTDAFESMSKTGRDANVGLCTQQQFRSTMGLLFKGFHLQNYMLDLICNMYGEGDPDTHMGGYQKVQWKQFAIDFDEIQPLAAEARPVPGDDILPTMMEMNIYCDKNAIQLDHEFEEYLGGKDKCTSDIMPREKFRQALGTILGRATSLYCYDEKVLDAMCHTYKSGPPLARDPSLFESVQWKRFALDVAELQPMPYLEQLTKNGVQAYPQKGELTVDY